MKVVKFFAPFKAKMWFKKITAYYPQAVVIKSISSSYLCHDPDPTLSFIKGFWVDRRKEGLEYLFH